MMMNYSILFLVALIVSTTTVTISPETSTSSGDGQSPTKISENSTGKVPISLSSQQINHADITTTSIETTSVTTTSIATTSIANTSIDPMKSNPILFPSTILTETYDKLNISTENIGLIDANQTSLNYTDNLGIRHFIIIPQYQKDLQKCPNGQARKGNGECVVVFQEPT